MREHARLSPDDERIRLTGPTRAIAAALAILGLAAFAAGLALGWSRHDALRALTASYLVNYMFFLSISLGALFFVILERLVRAGWSVTVRRLAEILAANLIWFPILFLPILVPLWLGWSGPYYKWLDPRVVADAPLSEGKAAYLSVPLLTIRALVYFVIWALSAWFFLKQSTLQDDARDPQLTRRMEKTAPVAMILFGLSVTFASFDWLMSLEPRWSSTIFGLYYFAGAVVGALAAMVLSALALQRGGMVRRAITVEHYHELGKLLLGFVIFWGYMAFSQYLLIWYANIPEETTWYLARQRGPWASVAVVVLLAHLLIPFLGLLPREVKRRKILLGAWSVWILAVHWLDIYWLVMPTFAPARLPFGMMDLCCVTSVGCLFLAGAIHTARGCSLVPVGDPRLDESLAFENL
jgi:hypothetical protein